MTRSFPHRRPQRSAHSILEVLEVRRLLAARAFDGTGNNLTHPDWGSTGQPLSRLAPAAYADGLSAPAGSTRPSARLISNTIVAHGPDDIPNSRSMSAFAYLWGQFID